MAAEKVNLLTMYEKWSYLDKNNNYVPITRPGRYVNGSENTADGQAVDFLSTEKSLIGKNVIPGFINRAKKYATQYPLSDEKTLEIARKQETDGTHNVPRYTSNLRYSQAFIRE
jgi:hypothetical protein